jgi:hypothetical protein
MLIRIGYELEFEVASRTPMLLLLYTHPSLAAFLREPDYIRIAPELPVQVVTDVFGNFCGRIVAPAGQLHLWNTTIIDDSGQPDPVFLDTPQVPIEQLPVEVLPYLLGSRYCEVDRLSQAAKELFGTTPLGWPRVQAICHWVHENVLFGYQFANPTKTAFDVFHCISLVSLPRSSAARSSGLGGRQGQLAAFHFPYSMAQFGKEFLNSATPKSVT